MTDSDDLKALFDLETFESGGRKLWDDMQDARDPGDVRALVVETCRVKDRLDRLNRLSTRDDSEWGRLLPTEDGGGTEFVLHVGAVLREQRQTEIVFKQLTSEIHRRRLLYDNDDLDEAGGLSDL